MIVTFTSRGCYEDGMKWNKLPLSLAPRRLMGVNYYNSMLPSGTKRQSYTLNNEYYLGGIQTNWGLTRGGWVGKRKTIHILKGSLEMLFIVEAEYSGRTWQLLIRQHLPQGTEPSSQHPHLVHPHRATVREATFKPFLRICTVHFTPRKIRVRELIWLDHGYKVSKHRMQTQIYPVPKLVSRAPCCAIPQVPFFLLACQKPKAEEEKINLFCVIPESRMNRVYKKGTLVQH